MSANGDVFRHKYTPEYIHRLQTHAPGKKKKMRGELINVFIRERRVNLGVALHLKDEAAAPGG